MPETAVPKNNALQATPGGSKLYNTHAQAGHIHNKMAGGKTQMVKSSTAI